MPRLLLTENITADGRIEMLDEWFDPSPGGDIGDWLDATERLGASSDAVLLGRQTFEDFRGYWPQHTDEPAVYPAIQGRGRGLVAEGTSLPRLELLESRAFRSGVALLRYAVAGD